MTDLNLYKRLLSLSPEPITQTALVQEVFADGTARVLIDGAGSLVLLNPLSVIEGKSVFVKERQIIGEAPLLPYFYIEI